LPEQIPRGWTPPGQYAQPMCVCLRRAGGERGLPQDEVCRPGLLESVPRIVPPARILPLLERQLFDRSKNEQPRRLISLLHSELPLCSPHLKQPDSGPLAQVTRP